MQPYALLALLAVPACMVSFHAADAQESSYISGSDIQILNSCGQLHAAFKMMEAIYSDAPEGQPYHTLHLIIYDDSPKPYYTAEQEKIFLLELLDEIGARDVVDIADPPSVKAGIPAGEISDIMDGSTVHIAGDEEFGRALLDDVLGHLEMIRVDSRNLDRPCNAISYDPSDDVPDGTGVPFNELPEFVVFYANGTEARYIEMNQNGTLELYIQGSDPDGDTITYSVSEGPDFIRLDEDGRTIHIDAAGVTPDVYLFRITADDTHDTDTYDHILSITD